MTLEIPIDVQDTILQWNFDRAKEIMNKELEDERQELENKKQELKRQEGELIKRQEDIGKSILRKRVDLEYALNKSAIEEL